MEFSQKTINGIIVCYIKGQIRISTQSECKDYFDKLISENSHTKAVLNMSGIGYMNSAGIGMIVDCFKKFRDNGGRIVLCSPVSDIRKLFEVTRLNRFIEIYPDEEAAIAAVST